jgi:hypothetical protein
MVKEFGEAAPIRASRRADALLAQGDVEGCKVWKRILEAVLELQRTERHVGETLN